MFIKIKSWQQKNSFQEFQQTAIKNFIYLIFGWQLQIVILLSKITDIIRVLKETADLFSAHHYKHSWQIARK